MIQWLYNLQKEFIAYTNTLYTSPIVVTEEPKWENYSWMNEPVTKYIEDCRKYESHIKLIKDIDNCRSTSPY